MNQLKELIKFDEGFRKFPYDDETGFLVKAPIGKLTIGYGWNIQDVGIEEQFASFYLDYILNHLIDELKRYIPFFIKLDELRQAVLINIAFNVGVGGLLKFKKTLLLISLGQYREAGIELLDSNAARKLPERYKRLSKMLITGEWI